MYWSSGCRKFCFTFLHQNHFFLPLKIAVKIQKNESRIGRFVFLYRVRFDTTCIKRIRILSWPRKIDKQVRRGFYYFTFHEYLRTFRESVVLGHDSVLSFLKIKLFAYLYCVIFNSLTTCDSWEWVREAYMIFGYLTPGSILPFSTAPPYI